MRKINGHSKEYLFFKLNCPAGCNLSLACILKIPTEYN